MSTSMGWDKMGTEALSNYDCGRMIFHPERFIHVVNEDKDNTLKVIAIDFLQVHMFPGSATGFEGGEWEVRRSDDAHAQHPYLPPGLNYWDSSEDGPEEEGRKT
ncbi:hypothetical protein EDD18DRAFT_1107734 [Armillaria luteobubalina]|uniref:Uncharacterized protein n=1 Tax=Armillaria luteobubalina TaxID=153913 RepID=A0AA39Q013_9AGAR|nr:hypothetical protein EDD18DRAFT_1107734 [Armillaria luteobubalina]